MSNSKRFWRHDANAATSTVVELRAQRPRMVSGWPNRNPNLLDGNHPSRQGGWMKYREEEYGC
jgi:hypothetical protein